MTTASIALICVTAATAFRRAGIQFAAGVNELDLLDLTAAQIIAIANEPALVMEGRLFGDDEWQVFPAPVAADLPMLEAQLIVAKEQLAEHRLALEAGRPDDDTDKLDADSAKSADAMVEPIGQLAASMPGPVTADQTAAADAPANTDKPQDGAAASAETAQAETEAGAASAPASGTGSKGKATK